MSHLPQVEVCSSSSTSTADFGRRIVNEVLDGRGRATSTGDKFWYENLFPWRYLLRAPDVDAVHQKASRRMGHLRDWLDDNRELRLDDGAPRHAVHCRK